MQFLKKNEHQNLESGFSDIKFAVGNKLYESNLCPLVAFMLWIIKFALSSNG